MTYTLPISSQNQVTLNGALRKYLDVTPKSIVVARPTILGSRKVIVLESPTKSWVARVAGIGKGMYGNVDEYIKNERNSWDRKTV
jgi:hypothetical protein